jgi:2',3'-cyclic-nucleotide 2'-phosphodiesterase (5'-nucleotidase family)
MRRRIVSAAACALIACARATSTPASGATAGTVARPDSIDLVIAGTTDVHGWLRGWDYFANAPDSNRGMTRLATILDSLRAAHPDRVVLVDAGDDLQGTPIATIALRDSTRPNPIIAAMNAMRYDAGVIGNHEFNYGLSYLHGAIAQARFPMLAANAFAPDGRHAYVPSVVVEKGGARVGIVGGTTPGTMIWDRDKVRGRIEVRDIVPAVRSAVENVRGRGAEVVVVVLHSGLADPSSYDTVATGVASENVAARVAREIPGIDVLVFGHTHRELADTTIGATLVQQPRNAAGSLSIARLRLGLSGGAYRVASKRGSVLRARGRAEQAALLATTQDAHDRAVAYVAAPIGNTGARWSADSARVKDTPILDLLLEVMRRTSGADLASTAAFNLNAEFGPGAITMADMAELYPYDNNLLRAIRITGKQLRDYLEFSARYFKSDSTIDSSVPGFNYDIVAGAEYVIDLSRPIGSRITSLTRNGRPIADTDSLTLALNDYRQVGGGGFSMLQGAPLVYDKQQVIRDLLVEEVQRRGTLRPEDYFQQNWRLVPDALVDAVHRSMRRGPYDRPAPPRRP